MHKQLLVLLLAVAGTGIVGGAAHAADATPKEQPKHIVVTGESLSSIATDNSLETWRPIWNANAGLANPDSLSVGQEIIIPAKDTPTADRPLPAGYGEPTPVASQPVAAAPAAKQPVKQRAAAAPAPAASGDILSRIRMRESGGNYATRTGNGYYGAYQYDVRTWGGYGGYTYASDAPASVQDAKAAATYAARGCSPWPNTCY